MSDTPDDPSWQRTSAALDELLSVLPAERAALIERLAADDAGFAQELRSLVDLLEIPDPLLDQSAANLLAAEPYPASLAPGARLGPWRIVMPIGRGGMGEVYRAERADGQFTQHVAIKVLRLDATAHLERFHAERQIVARLDHPFIARLFDGDVGPDGRPYMVMEYVAGQSIVEWCREQHATLDQRLKLFLQVCDAVAYAHRHLIIHCDLKPNNVLVTPDGRPKLLDFGVARLLDRPVGDPTREIILTPGYAPPEQLTGAPLTTSADVYLLGLMLHELLCDQPAHPVQHLALATAIHTVLSRPPRPPSRIARALPEPVVPSHRLAGDLDAIVARALRSEPEQRYASVAELSADLERYLQHLPVQARRGSWAYVASRAIRRHRALAVGASIAVLAIAAGTTAALWQAHLARAEAARAGAVRDFLVHVFSAADPRVASDRPRGLTTARELLDAGAKRVDTDFSSQPALQMELLGLIATLYRELGEHERYAAVQDWRASLARAHPGQFLRNEIEVLINQIGDDDNAGERGQARAKLLTADRLLDQAGLNDSVIRARWWLANGQSQEPADFVARESAFSHALALFGKHAVHDPGRVTALTEMGLVFYDRGDNEGAIGWYRQAFQAYQTSLDRNDAEAQTIWGNLGAAYLNLGRYDDAEAAQGHAADLARQTYGEHHVDYWVPAATHARILHLNGRRAEALQQFAALRAVMPYPPQLPAAWEALAAYVDCLVAEGAAAPALPLAEGAEQYFLVKPGSANSVRRIRMRLGEIYEQLGRIADARQAFSLAYEEYRRTEPVTRQTVLAITERWARFLVAHGSLADAQRMFAEVVARDGDRHLAHGVLAHAGLARVALAQGDLATALRESETALAQWAAVRGFRDVRMGPYVQCVRASVLLAAGDGAGARRLAAAALEASERFDASGAASIAEAAHLLQSARLSSPDKSN